MMDIATAMAGSTCNVGYVASLLSSGGHHMSLIQEHRASARVTSMFPQLTSPRSPQVPIYPLTQRKEEQLCELCTNCPIPDSS
ncbi:hypothetical protein E2C01_014977 [Portunus trituberculatus]|uniref:Uncharacterized protein n=1 Tax=Portunus trituberculatus TaxID=210409 RepID=A0A5B7DLQ5_PORTR|nr:hypothetical protein [Portunus trituberculatus]